MRKLSAKWVPKCMNAGQKRQRCQSSKQILEFFRRDPNDFLSRLVTMNETWLYHYDPETKQQSMVWWHRGSPRPKNSECKNPLEKFSPWFFWDQDHWLSFKGPNYQRGVLLISAGAIEGHFEGKTPREDHQGGLVLARQCPCSPDTCNPEETGLPGLPVSWSPTLFSRSGPVGLPPVLCTEKKTIESWPFFLPTRGHCCCGSWFDRQYYDFFLSGLQKLEQRAKKCIDLRGEYVEKIPSLVAVACFLPGRVKDSSAPPRRIFVCQTWRYVKSPAGFKTLRPILILYSYLACELLFWMGVHMSSLISLVFRTW